MSYKLYEITWPGAKPTLLNSETVTEIVLGEEGRGRRAVRIPVIGEGEYFRPKRMSSGSLVLFRTNEPPQEPGAVLLVANTHGGYSKGRYYTIKHVEGPDFWILANGLFAEGMAGRAMGADHVLAVIYPQTTVLLNSKYASHYYTWDGMSWTMRSNSEWLAFCALREAQSGEGEWL